MRLVRRSLTSRNEPAHLDEEWDERDRIGVSLRESSVSLRDRVRIRFGVMGETHLGRKKVVVDLERNSVSWPRSSAAISLISSPREPTHKKTHLSKCPLFANAAYAVFSTPTFPVASTA